MAYQCAAPCIWGRKEGCMGIDMQAGTYEIVN